MFGITSTGCFFTGIIFGFILALFLGAACVFYFNPAIKEKSLNKVEEVWNSIKSGVDNSLSVAKNAPTAEPEIPAPKPGNSRQMRSGTPVVPQTPAPERRPKIEIKLGI